MGKHSFPMVKNFHNASGSSQATPSTAKESGQKRNVSAKSHQKQHSQQ